jgi:hypothetical protein
VHAANVPLNRVQERRIEERMELKGSWRVTMLISGPVLSAEGDRRKVRETQGQVNALPSRFGCPNGGAEKAVFNFVGGW